MSNNVTIPATGSGTATPNIETYDTTGSNGPQRQSITLASVGAPASVTALSGTPASGLQVGHKTVTNTSTLTRPANTTAYAVGNLIASSTTAGSVTVPSFTAAGANGGGFHLSYLRLVTNATSGMGSASIQINLWDAAPTYTNGDGGAYAPATGAAHWLGSFTVVSMVQGGDGAWGGAVPDVGNQLDLNTGASSTVIYWDLTAGTVFTPASGQTFTLHASLIED